MSAPSCGAAPRFLPRLSALLAASMLVASMLVAMSSAALAAPPSSLEQERTRYIIVFKPNASSVREQAQALANGAGAKPYFVYEHALKGFVVTLPTHTSRLFLDAMSRHPLVLDGAPVDQDRARRDA